MKRCRCTSHCDICGASPETGCDCGRFSWWPLLIVALFVFVFFMLGGCASRPPVPPVLIPDISAPPADCMQVLELALPAGSTPEDVISAQHTTILAYEARVKACGIVPELRK